ncbi:MAG: methyltransferase domain-containing protein [Oligoflexia bacterium]|nr:methyltransferase domain-containing protein [Oligoflexia bacterium]
MRTEQQQRWDSRYRDGNLPWDAGQPAPDLVSVLPTLGLAAGTCVLEVGSGTGTNAVWLAQQGLRVTAVDISPAAARLARARAQAATVQVNFAVIDWLSDRTVDAHSQSLVFDRGCFHIHDAEGRASFAQQVHRVLRPWGAWLSLAGNADEESVGGGPPRVSVADIAAAVEPWFEIQQLRSIHFRADTGALAWLGLYRKRRPQRPTFSKN